VSPDHADCGADDDDDDCGYGPDSDSDSDSVYVHQQCSVLALVVFANGNVIVNASSSVNDVQNDGTRKLTVMVDADHAMTIANVATALCFQQLHVDMDECRDRVGWVPTVALKQCMRAPATLQSPRHRVS